jgi:hypothetical protein
MATSQQQPPAGDPSEHAAEVRETETFTLELTLQEMGFLRLLLTNATIQPAELKKLCGEVQAKVESHIGPLPPTG